MADCLLNFFDSSASSSSPPDPPPPQPHPSPLLELTLSLSLPSPIDPFPSPSDSSPPLSLPFPPPLPSRDQIWHNLQRNPAAPPRSRSDASSHMEIEALLNRRSASVQVVVPFCRDFPPGTPPRSRSCSHGILPNLPPSAGGQFLLPDHPPVAEQPPPSSRHFLMPDHHLRASGVDSDHMKRKDATPAPTDSHAQNDLAELQKRREMQAHRRLQARKRRRSLMEEKQLKKGARPDNSNGSQRLQPAVSADEKSLRQASLEGRLDALEPDSARYGSRCPKLVSSASATHEDEPGAEKAASDSSRHGPEKALSCSIRRECGAETGVSSDSIRLEHGAPIGVSSDSLRLEYGADTRASSDSSRNDQGTPRSQKGTPMESSADAEGLDSKSQGDEGPAETTSSERREASALGQLTSQKHAAESRIAIATSSVLSSMPDRTSSSNVSCPIKYFALRKASSGHENMSMPQRCNSISSEGWLPSSSACSVSNSVRTVPGQREGRAENPALLSSPVSNSNIKTPLPDAEAQIIFPAHFGTMNPKASAFCKFGGSKNEGHTTSLPVERQQSWPAASLSRGKPVLSSNQCLPMFRPPYVGQTETVDQGNTRSLQDCDPAESSRSTILNQSSEIDRQKSGAFLDLPSVTTTGRGPHGRTINGVMYITSAREVQLICNCHGKHMSPVEFVAHSGSSDLSNPERSIVVNPFPFFNQVASTPV